MQTAPMQTVDRLEAALRLAERLGYRVRLESLIGEAGGGCEIRGQKWLFVDLSLTPHEQLEQVLATLRREAARIKAAAGSGGADGAGPSAETPFERDVSIAASKSSQGFLPRWRRWYRMVVGKQAGSR